MGTKIFEKKGAKLDKKGAKSETSLCFFPTGESRAESFDGVLHSGKIRVESLDDDTIGIKKTEKTIRALINIIDEFRSISGLSARNSTWSN